MYIIPQVYEGASGIGCRERANMIRAIGVCFMIHSVDGGFHCLRPPGPGVYADTTAWARVALFYVFRDAGGIAWVFLTR